MLKTTQMARSFFAQILLILILAILMGSLTAHTIKTHRQELLANKIDSALLQKIDFIKGAINSHMDAVSFLADTPPISGIIRATENHGIDAEEDTPIALWQQRLSRIFVAYLRNDPYIFQLRYIGLANQGKELVRVDKIGGLIQVAKPGILQSKGNRDYFQQIIQQQPNQLYVSAINLNREHGQLEYPYHPTIRIAQPVIDDRGKMFGFIIANIDIQPTLDQVADTPSNLQAYLTDNDGNFLVHPNKEKAFQFDVAKAYHWSDAFAEAQLIDKNSGLQFYRPKDQDEPTIIGKRSHFILHENSTNSLELNLAIAEPEQDWNTLLLRAQLIGWGVIALIGLSMMGIVTFYHNHLRRQHHINVQLTQYESVYQGSMDAIFSIDDQLQIRSCNTACQDLLRQPIGLLIDRKITELIPNLQQSLPQGNLSEDLKSRSSIQIETTHDLPSGTQLYLLVSLFKAYQQGEDALFGVIIRDITEKVLNQREIEAANNRLEEEVNDRTAELLAARDKALKANDAINAFVANVSHELRTPINGIMGMLSSLEHQPLPLKAQERVTIAQRSAESLLALVNDILDISKIEAGRIDFEIIETDLQLLFSDLIDTLGSLLISPDVQLLLDLAELEVTQVYCDPVRVKQIFTNLLANAIKFTEQGEVRLSVKSHLDSQGAVTLEAQVRDSGIGIMPEKIDALFEKFTQEDSSTTRRFGGTGLGLPICKELVHLMDGTLEVASEKSKGSQFTIRLSFTAATPGQNRNDILNPLQEKQLLLCLQDEPLDVIICRQLQAWHLNCKRLLTPELQALNPKNSHQRYLLISEALFKQQPIDLEAFDKVILIDPKNRRHPPDSLAKQITLLQAPITPISLLAALTATEKTDQADPTDTSNSHLNEDWSAYCLMIVDDNEINIEVAKGLLSNQQPQILVAHDGQEALNLLISAEHDISLILMDCQMPIMDGYSATTEIRAGAAGSKLANIPIIAMTAGAMQGDKEHCLASGMNDYLTKPLIKKEVIEKLGRFLSMTKPQITSLKTPALLAEFSHLADFNPTPAKQRLAGNEDLWQRVISIFLSDYEKQLSKLYSSIEAGDKASIKFMAHQLKGVTASVGLDKASALCRHLELHIEDANVDTQACFQAIQTSIKTATSQIV